MSLYQYVALNASGQEVKDEIEAQTRDEAIAKIRQLGRIPTKLKEKAAKKAEKAAKKAEKEGRNCL